MVTGKLDVREAVANLPEEVEEEMIEEIKILDENGEESELSEEEDCAEA